jgi:DNA-binding beta-propeller fold protein YncE
VGPEGTLYVADDGGLQRRDAQGNWSVLGTEAVSALAVDGEGNLYLADRNIAGFLGRIQQRDAQGNWRLIAGETDSSGHVYAPTAVAVDADGSLYIADRARIQKRDGQGNWSVIATTGPGLGQVSSPAALAVDRAGNLYVADGENQGVDVPRGRIQRRDAQGRWSTLAAAGTALGQVDEPMALATDAAGSLYVGEGAPLRTDLTGASLGRVQRRDAQGRWTALAPSGAALGPVWMPRALAVDAESNLYVAENPPGAPGRIEQRDAEGNWSVLVDGDPSASWINGPSALAVDAAGSLYVVDYGSDGGRIQKRDAQGNWSLIATAGAELGQISYPAALAVDEAGNLYVADTRNDRVLKYTPASGP